MLVTSLIVLNTVLIAALIVFLYIFKRSVPDLIQGVLNDVGGELSRIFEKPQVSRAMSVLGKQSGDARADKALRKKAAGVVMDRMPGLGMILDQFGMTPLEGVKLLGDPLFGPLIRQGLGAAQKALGKINLGGGGGGQSFKGYGHEE